MSNSSGWADPSSLYLHIPFCPYKCPYCDFVTYVGGAALMEPYVEAISREIALQAQMFPGHSLETVFFGGGTPSMLTPDQINRILITVDGSFGIRSGAEISLEANPDTVNQDSLTGLRSAGVNRLSLGVQSLETNELKLLGRGHSSQQVTEVVRHARASGFENLSLDLIYGVPEQTLASWVASLTGALALQPDHISAYSLIVEPGTPYKRLEKIGRLHLPEDDLVADMYVAACEILAGHGFDHYEVANWSRPGLQARHNLTYWHDEQFFAAGVGAYDYIRPHRSVRVRSTKRYIEAINRGDPVVAGRDFVGVDYEKFETAVMRLRLLREGLDRRIYKARFSRELDEDYGPVVADLVALGFLENAGEALRLLETKVPLANEAWERFLPESPTG